VKEKFVKGSMIAKIPSCERKVRDLDSRDYRRERKGSLIAEGTMKSPDPTLKGYPIERPKTITSCGLDPP
jgi:hypothetical protein